MFPVKGGLTGSAALKPVSPLPLMKPHTGGGQPRKPAPCPQLASPCSPKASLLSSSVQCRRMDGSNFLSGGEVQSGVLGTDEMSGPSCT